MSGARNSMETDKAERDRKLGLINGLRGLAIIGVIMHHSFFFDFMYGAADQGWSLFSLLMSSGWLGVNLFFFLSGFVLYLPYAMGNRRIGTRAEIIDFYRRRFLRLMPLYWLVWIISLVFLSGQQLGDKDFYIAAFLYVTVLFPFNPHTFYPPGNWVFWSLGLEIWFSVLFPVIVLCLLRFGWRVVFPLACILAFAVRLTGQMFAAAPEGEVLNFVSDSVLGRLDEFLYGMLAAWLYVQTRPVTTGWWMLIGVVAISAALFIWQNWYLHQIPLEVTAFAVNLLDLGIFLTVLTLLQHHNLIGGLLSNWILQLLGMMCYSIYLWHGIVQQHFSPSFKAGLVQYAAYLSSVLVLSFLSYRYVEFGRAASWRDLLPRHQGIDRDRMPAKMESK